MRAQPGHPGDGGGHCGMGVTDHHHPETVVKIDVLVPVDVEHLRTRPPGHVNRMGRLVLERGRDPGRHNLLGPLVDLLRTRRPVGQLLLEPAGQLRDAILIDPGHDHPFWLLIAHYVREEGGGTPRTSELEPARRMID